MEQKVKGIDQLIENKFLNYYTAHYETDGKPRDYFFVSRHKKEDLAILNDEVKPTAIEAFTYYIDEDTNDYYVVMIEEFRSAIGRYVTSFTAGLIEKDEDVNTAIAREVSEEIGGKVESISLLQNYPLAMCAGMTDESNYMAIVQLKSLGQQHLEPTEDIKVKVYELKELHKLVEANKIQLTVSGLLGFYALWNYLI